MRRSPVTVMALGLLLLIGAAAEGSAVALQERYNCPAEVGGLRLDSPKDGGLVAPWAGRTADFRAGCAYAGGQVRLLADWKTAPSDLQFGTCEGRTESLSRLGYTIWSPDRHARAEVVTGGNEVLRDAGRTHVRGLLGFAEERAMSCTESPPAAPPSPPAPAPPPPEAPAEQPEFELLPALDRIIEQGLDELTPHGDPCMEEGCEDPESGTGTAG